MIAVLASCDFVAFSVLFFYISFSLSLRCEMGGHPGTSHSSPNHHQLPCHIFLSLIDSLKSLPFQRWFSFGKSQKSQDTNLGCREAESPGWFDISPENCTRRDAWVGVLWWSCQLPIAITVDFWIIWIVSVEKCSSLMQIDTGSLLYSLSHFKCNSHTGHTLTQWHLPPPLTSTMTSSLFTHVHSSPLPLAARLHQCHTNCSHYINNGWTFSGQTLYALFTIYCWRTGRK